ncbi:SLOG family protein [Nocardia fusca]|uniref:SLOG family protein n=1 Tax=Nocardia fusca TaxID=941183 RepID=A0ABV3F8C7_9NOCA
MLPEYRILVTGSRSWTDSATIRDALAAYKGMRAVLVHGDSRGADRIAASIWQSWGGKVETHRADWDQYGKKAGPLRNQQMVAAGADICLAFNQADSAGTAHTMRLAREAGIQVCEFTAPGIERPYTPPAQPQQRPAGASYQAIVEALERRVGPGKGYRSPEAWTRFLCPVHEGDGGHHNPSLGVRYDPGQGKTIVRCFAANGCDDRNVMERIGLRVRDLWDNLPERDPNQRHQQNRTAVQRPARPVELPAVEKAIRAARFEIAVLKPDLGAVTGPKENVDAYMYRWPGGRTEGAVLRRETPHEHGRAKEFTQRRWTGSEWVNTGFEPLPYRLPELLDGIKRGREIYICEGEKDVDRAERSGLVATCNAMGAGSWKPEHARWLHGAARVFVVADRDRPGYRHAAKVADSLEGLVGEVRVVQARDGKDLSDHFDAGHGIEDLEPVPYLDRPRTQREQPPPAAPGRVTARERAAARPDGWERIRRARDNTARIERTR